MVDEGRFEGACDEGRRGGAGEGRGPRDGRGPGGPEGGHRGPRRPPIEGMQPNPCGGFSPQCPANPNPAELIAQLEEMHRSGGSPGPGGPRGPRGPHGQEGPDGRPDFSAFPERPCGRRKPRCPLMEDEG